MIGRKKNREKECMFALAVPKKKHWGYQMAVFVMGWLLMGACYFACLRSYGKVEKAEAVSIVLSDREPIRSEIRSILKTQKETGREEEVCFYWEGSLVSAMEPVYGRSTRAFLAGVQGEAALFDWRIRGFSDEDREGCIIDRETALELFGTAKAEGRQLQIQKDTYQVRRVIDWKQRLILIHNEDRDAQYSRVFFQCKSGNKTNMADQFLMRYGLSGEQASADAVHAMAGAAVWLFPLALFLELFFYAARQMKTALGKKEKWIWKGFCLILAAVTAYGIWCNFSLAADWLPGKWSDFSFWSRRMEEERERIVYFFMVARTARETEILYEAVCTIFQGIFAVVLFLLLTKMRKRKNV